MEWGLGWGVDREVSAAVASVRFFVPASTVRSLPPAASPDPQHTYQVVLEVGGGVHESKMVQY
jgi:hypothetical protein